MSRSRRQEPEQIALYKDETVLIPRGEVRYTIDLDDEEIEKLAAGCCPRRVMEAAYRMLAWKREAMQDWQSFEPAKKVSA